MLFYYNNKNQSRKKAILRYLKTILKVLHDIKLPNPDKEVLVFKRLKRMLVSAYLNVPYYRKIMKDIEYNPIKDFNGVGDLKDFFLINIATDENYFNVIIGEIRQSLNEHFPQSCIFKIIRVDRIDCNKNGKLSPFVSELKI